MQDLQKRPAALALKYFLVQVRAFGFRVLSRLACGLHWLVRVPHRGCPYSVFKILRANEADLQTVLTLPECMRDEFCHAFLKRYPPSTCEYRPNSEEFAVLQCLAELLPVDIAGIESRHASVRRLALKKSLQAWVLEFQQLSAEFTCRQVASCRAGPYETEKTTGEGNCRRP